MLRSFLLLALAAVGFVGGFGSTISTAQAGERVLTYDARVFIEAMDVAFSADHPYMGVRFLQEKATKTVRFENRLVSARAAMQGSTWWLAEYGRYDGVGAIWQYPAAYSNAPYVRELNSAYGSLSGLVAEHVNKRRRIPNYSRQTVLEGFSMEDGASEGRALVRVIESSGHRTVSRSQCRMHLQKDKWGVRMSALSCQVLAPVL